ncbi:response regulator [Curvivirga aplysinae]|uniref:response regulator n=1 Tax=Curvivirga aplysinae TaxID=2529852 RepID=UPI0012BC2397|nr:response regulator [Curvivirga aplysinae]MTI08217.1 response regulator [Curvivirga aplysinae]
MRKVLLVDDDANLLSGLKRHFRKKYSLFTATSGAEALKIANENEDIAVVVSDMSMPEMTGLEFLKKLKVQNKSIIGIMLTGNIDQQTAVDAINEGEIFRFLKKPCDSEALSKVIDAAIKQFNLINAEKELLESTLAGSLKFLVDLFAFTAPRESAHAGQVRELVMQYQKNLLLENFWQVNLAAMLLPFSNFIASEELQEKRRQKLPLNAEDIQEAKDSLGVMNGLLQNIPRVNEVSSLINDNGLFDLEGVVPQNMESQLLTIANYIVSETSNETFLSTKKQEFLDKFKGFDERILDTVWHYHANNATAEDVETISLPIGLLEADYRLMEDLISDAGRLLLAKDTVISAAHLKKIEKIIEVEKISNPITVQRQVSG